MQQSGEQERGSVSSLALCLQSMAREGRAAVLAEAPGTDDADAVGILEGWDAGARAELGLALPAFSVAAALWGARLFHQLCRFIVCREIGEAEIKAACTLPCPEPRGPETDWSVDLTLRHLPKLYELARQLSNADPLLEQMRQVAAAWPLSSAGIGGLGRLQLESFIHHPGLRRLYGDRIIAAGDSGRLGEAEVNDMIRADLGLHRELAPGLAGKLFDTTHDAH